MRYRLRTLMVVLALGPPVVAGLWLTSAWLIRDSNAWVLAPIAVYLGAVALAVNCKRMFRAIAGYVAHRGRVA